MKNISKRFGDVQALDNVSITIREEEILGLLGENGAGKTTLMNILYGLYKADSGEIYIDGKKTKIRSPSDAIQKGIFMVHQHFKLIPNFTVLDNIIIGFQKGKDSLKFIDYNEERKKIEEIMEEHSLMVPLDKKVRDLPLGVQQRVEIIKALYRGARLLILDEPTTNLTPQESEQLLKTIKEIKKRKLSVVLITHKIKEVIDTVDRVVVLRKGKVTGEVEKNEIDPQKIVEMMVGRRVVLEELLPSLKEDEAKIAKRKVILKVEGLTVTQNGIEVVKNVDLDIKESEIHGIAGVAGNGQRELVEAIFGSIPISKGKILFMGRDVTRLPPIEKLKLGITFIPEDRLRDGVLPTMNIAENLVLGYHKLSPYGNKLFLDYKTIIQNALEAIRKYDIKTPSEKQLAGRLSGGNIQKLMIARAHLINPKLLLAHTPTRGLDIGMTEKVLKKMIEIRNSGGAVLFVSEDLDQLLLVSDRISVMYKGEIVGTIERKDFDKRRIGELMMGLKGGT